VLKSSLNINPFAEDLKFNVREYLENLPIDIDFDVMNSPRADTEDKEFYMASVKISINEENQEGYSIVVEAAGLFSFSQDKMPSEAEKSDLVLSGINITITSIRNYITTITTFSPFGQYILPTIDMNDLFTQKKGNEK
jgi:preprotein translocase subunit SecB